MDNNKTYVSPRLTAHDLKDVPEWVTLLREDLIKGAHVAPTYTTVADRHRNYVEVPESFCNLVGYGNKN
jgi:hypothetical protein